MLQSCGNKKKRPFFAKFTMRRSKIFHMCANVMMIICDISAD